MKKIILLFFFLFSVEVGAEKLSIITWNVGDSDYSPPSAISLARLLAQKNEVSDILIIQEAFYKRFIKLKSILAYKYSIHSSQLSPNLKNIGILSRKKISDPKLLLFDKHFSGALKCNIGKMQIICVHFPYIRSKKRNDKGYVKIRIFNLLKILKNEIFHENLRKKEAKKLLLWADRKNTIIAGDFNTITLSSCIREIKKSYKNSISDLKALFTISGTYKKINFPFKPRVDFIFTSKNIKVKKSYVIKETNGDHYPVKAEIEL